MKWRPTVEKLESGCDRLSDIHFRSRILLLSPISEKTANEIL